MEDCPHYWIAIWWNGELTNVDQCKYCSCVRNSEKVEPTNVEGHRVQ